VLSASLAIYIFATNVAKQHGFFVNSSLWQFLVNKTFIPVKGSNCTRLKTDDLDIILVNTDYSSVITKGFTAKLRVPSSLKADVWLVSLQFYRPTFGLTLSRYKPSIL
jgi:hypothetical protein